jgi:hypothetical protein
MEKLDLNEVIVFNLDLKDWIILYISYEVGVSVKL